jgi:hypothetical protein
LIGQIVEAWLMRLMPARVDAIDIVGVGRKEAVVVVGIIGLAVERSHLE